MQIQKCKIQKSATFPTLKLTVTVSSCATLNFSSLSASRKRSLSVPSCSTTRTKSYSNCHWKSMKNPVHSVKNPLSLLPFLWKRLLSLERKGTEPNGTERNRTERNRTVWSVGFFRKTGRLAVLTRKLSGTVDWIRSHSNHYDDLILKSTWLSND